MVHISIESLKTQNRESNVLGYYSSTEDKFVFHAAKIERNLLIAKERQQQRTEYEENRQYAVGDIILLPNGVKVKISHVWDESVQTTHGGSFHIHKGGSISYSGGLDSGLKKSDLIETENHDNLICWFFEGDYSRAHSAVYIPISVRVWEVKKRADFSGVPQMSKAKTLKK